MILCPSCSFQNSDDDKFCKECGRELGFHKGKANPESYSNQDEVINRPVYSDNVPHSTDDYEALRASYGLGLHRRQGKLRARSDRVHPIWFLISAIIPFVGIILFFLWKDEKPISARFALRAGVLNFFLFFTLGLF